MELRLGYKHTEVGVIPEDWQVMTLAKVCQMKSGESITSASIDQFSAYPCYGGNGLRGFTSRFTHNGKYAFIGRQGALCGNVLGVDGKFFASEHAIVVTSVPKTDISWLTFVLGGMHLNQYSESSAQPGLSVAKILGLEISSPPTLAEQQAIAEALNDVDALIEALEQLIAKKRKIKQGAMQELLTGKLRLLGYEGNWEVKRLGDISEMNSGGTPLTTISSYYDGDIPWVSISDMTKGGKGIDSTERNLTPSGLTHSSAKMFPLGTVLYAMYASIGECSIAMVPLCSSQAILGIRPKENLDGEFLYYYLISLKPTIKLMGQQGTQANLNAGMVRGFEINLPPKKEQAPSLLS